MGLASSSTRIVLAHDWLVGMRGGERVLDRLAALFGPTTIYALVSDGRRHTPAIDACRVVTSALQRFPAAAGRMRRWYLPLMPWAVEGLQVEPCDLLISTSSAVMKSIIPPQNVPHICYCHSPARYIWEQTDDYSRGARGGLRGAGLRAVRRRFQRWDRATAARVTRFIANSSHTAARIQRCYGRDAVVVHPPVRTEFFTIDATIPREDWYLVVAALEPYKMTHIAIEAANRRRIPLRVAGAGSQFDRLRRAAGPTVQMLGRVDDETLRGLYRRARALLFPQVEDFGIVPVEAQACGCPLIAFEGGGALDIVQSTGGVLFQQQTEAALMEAIERFERTSFCPSACRANSLRFSEAAFDAAMQRQAGLALEGSSVAGS
jgi:glycosyltransferase involved in cell wall biosynthesis